MIRCLSAFLLIVSTAASAGGYPPVQEALRKAIELPKVNAPLRQALLDIAIMGRLRIEADWPALTDAGVDMEEAIIVRAARATPEQLLDVALVQAAPRGTPLAWYIDDQVVRVSTQTAVLRRNRGYISPRFAEPAVSTPPRAGVTPARDAPRPAQAIPPSAGPARRDVSFDGLPLGDVIQFFRDISGANIYVNWRSLATVGVDRTTPITLKVSGVPISRSLDLVTEQLGAGGARLDRIYWVIDEGVVVVATGATLDDTLRTRVYEVAHLLMPIPNFTGPQLQVGVNEGGSSNSGSSSGGSFWGSQTQQTQEPQQPNLHADALVAVIQNSIGEDMWQPIGKGSVQIVGSKMVVSQTLLGFKLLENAARR